jgi:hypothetical protein
MEQWKGSGRACMVILVGLPLRGRIEGDGALNFALGYFGVMTDVESHNTFFCCDY